MCVEKGGGGGDGGAGCLLAGCSDPVGGSLLGCSRCWALQEHLSTSGGESDGAFNTALIGKKLARRAAPGAKVRHAWEAGGLGKGFRFAGGGSSARSPGVADDRGVNRFSVCRALQVGHKAAAAPASKGKGKVDKKKPTKQARKWGDAGESGVCQALVRVRQGRFLAPSVALLWLLVSSWLAGREGGSDATAAAPRNSAALLPALCLCS